MMNRIRLAVVDAFFAIPRGGVEIGGILFGSFEPGRVLVQAFRTLECEHAAGPSFSLSEADRGRLAPLLASAADDRELAGLVPVDGSARGLAVKSRCRKPMSPSSKPSSPTRGRWFSC